MLNIRGFINSLKQRRKRKQNISIKMLSTEEQKFKKKTENKNETVKWNMIYSLVICWSIPGYATHFAGCISNKLNKSASKTTKFCFIDLNRKLSKKLFIDVINQIIIELFNFGIIFNYVTYPLIYVTSCGVIWNTEYGKCFCEKLLTSRIFEMESSTVGI